MATPIGFLKENPRGKLFGVVIRVEVLFISFVSQALIVYFLYSDLICFGLGGLILWDYSWN